MSDENKNDLWKVRLLLKRDQEGCRNLPRPRNVSLDKKWFFLLVIVLYFSFSTRKPNPTGLKGFALASPNGLVGLWGLCRKQTHSNKHKKICFRWLSLFQKELIFIFTGSSPLIKSLVLQAKGNVMENRIPAEFKPKMSCDHQLYEVFRKENRHTCSVPVIREIA